MEQLTNHIHHIRQQHSDDHLMVVFDIDGTILDMRYMVQNVLRAFDQEHHTRLFHQLTVDDITFHENQLEFFIKSLALEAWEKEHLQNWYLANRWTSRFVQSGHRAFPRILESIRWLKQQPDVEVGLNTGRPEHIREDTLKCLNALAADYDFSFSNDLLHMNPGDWEEQVVYHKVAGINYFQRKGYRVVTFIDNEPANLAAVAEYDASILLLHADTLYESDNRTLPQHSIRVRL
ncbi:MAG: HAD family hydrolase [Chloroflexi bacterium]|nr:HAD family hydrolase [Chloroflexota bacterium]